MAGLGLWCLLRAVLSPTPPLERALAGLSAPRTPSAPSGSGEGGVDDVDGPARRAAGWIMAVTNTNLRLFAADLAVLERSEEVHLVQRVRTGTFYGLLPLLVWFVTYLAGAAVIPPLLLITASLVLGVGGWFGTDAQVRSRALRRRAEFDTALVTFVSLVSILLSGGAGIQEALHESVAQGQGWPFTVLRRALTDSRVRGVSPWEALDEHGTRLGLTSLVDLAATMELAGTSGAHVRDSLMTKAEAIRAHEIATIEREATSRTTAMVGPTGLMMTGFVILVIYPAFQAVLDL
jgi:Flp pilus assembly protein TadB